MSSEGGGEWKASRPSHFTPWQLCHQLSIE
jgi:hypothetical protein